MPQRKQDSRAVLPAILQRAVIPGVRLLLEAERPEERGDPLLIPPRFPGRKAVDREEAVMDRPPPVAEAEILRLNNAVLEAL